jgi:CheY-like chemotaxis protein
MTTTVSVIDDERPIRLLCRVNLEAEGMQVSEAPDGPNGIELARGSVGRDPPRRDDAGPRRLAVAEDLLDDERTSSIPIVFLTARAELATAPAASTSAASTTSRSRSPGRARAARPQAARARRARRGRRPPPRAHRRAALGTGLKRAPSVVAPRAIARTGRAQPE